MNSLGVKGSCYLKTLRELILIFSLGSIAWEEEGSLLADICNLGVEITHESDGAQHQKPEEKAVVL